MTEAQPTSQADNACVESSPEEIEHDVRQVLAALTAMLTGSTELGDGRGQFADLMMVAGAPLDGAGLLWLGQLARANGCHALHVSMEVGSAVPNIALAHLEGGRLSVFENCLLLLGTGDRRTTIAPDSLAEGGFGLDGAGRLQRRPAPATLAAATPPARRALRRFHGLRATLDATSVAPVRCSLR